MLRKVLKIALIFLLSAILVLVVYFFWGKGKSNENVVWGVNFSQQQAQDMGLNWKEAYLALLDDLKIKNLKLIAQWDLIEKKEAEYDFNDLDWQVKEARDRQAKIILTMGLKTPRWPECHIPDWAASLSVGETQGKILGLLEKIVLKYRDEKSIWAWQVENEPFFSFGECPKTDKDFLRQEIDLVKSLDPLRPVIISESGEFPLWFKAAKFGDIVGVTLYREVWFKEFNRYVHYYFPPIFYSRKALLIKKIFNKDVICVELQAEPWGPTLLYSSPVEEQEKTMNLEKFKNNIEFASKTGLKEFYLWGSEWWYWLKEKQNKPEIWQEAKKLF
jgi:hypothetical protein